MKNKNFLPAVFAGLAAGALLGMLFAEQKGTETRNELRTGYNNWMDKWGRRRQRKDGFNETFEEPAPTNP